MEIISFLEFLVRLIIPWFIGLLLSARIFMLWHILVPFVWIRLVCRLLWFILLFHNSPSNSRIIQIEETYLRLS